MESGTGRILGRESAEAQGARSGKFVVRPGDVVLSKIRPALRKVALSDFIGTCSADMYPLRSTEEVLPEFIHAVLLGREFSQYAESVSGRSGIPKINRKELSGFKLRVPPIREQLRIVKTLTAMTQSERSISDSITKTRLIRSEVVRALMTSEPWPKQTLGELATVTSGSTPSRARAEFWTSGVVPWVKTAEINFSAISDTTEHITWPAVRETGLRVFHKGTVLLAMYGEGVTRGRSAILNVEATVNQAAAAIVCKNRILTPQFLFYWLESSYTALRKIGQGSNQTNLNASLVESIKVPLPPLNMQQQVIDRLAAFDTQLTADTDELRKLRKLKIGLTDDLLAGNPH